MNWVMLYKIGEAFNRDGISNGFNGKLKADNILNWFVWLAVCGWILNLNIVGLMILQQQQQQKRIKLIIGGYSTQEETHSTGGVELEMASKRGATTLPIL